MAVTGHKTASIFRRYDIVTEDDLAVAMDRVTEHLATQPKKAATVVPLNRTAHVQPMPEDRKGSRRMKNAEPVHHRSPSFAFQSDVKVSTSRRKSRRYYFGYAGGCFCPCRSPCRCSEVSLALHYAHYNFVRDSSDAAHGRPPWPLA